MVGVEMENVVGWIVWSVFAYEGSGKVVGEPFRVR
jgi:hypothetical protein